MKFFKKKPSGKQKMVLDGEMATAAKALYTGPRTFPRIQLKFKIRHGYDKVRGEEFDEIEIDMDLIDAADLSRELIAAVQAATPSVSRGARQTQYGE